MKMKQSEFIVLTAFTMALTALAIDIMLPTFAQVREHFGLPRDSTDTAKIISFFFMGQCAQIIFGTLSDRFGRLTILRTGFPFYIIGGIGAAFAPSLPFMYAARFIAGMGASALLMSAVAGVRDRFMGDRMARIMSLVLTIFLYTPVVAPFLGVAILSFASWKMVFLTPPAFAVLVFLWSFRLEESLPRDRRIALEWINIGRSIWKVVSNRVFLLYTGITTTLFAALSAYVGSSEHIIGEIYNRPKLFAWIFGGIALLCSFSTLTNSRLSLRYGARRVIRWLLISYTVVASSLLLFTCIVGDPPSMPVFFIGVALMTAINLAVEPNSSALALEPLGNVAGTAASLYGTSFFLIGALLGSLISQVMVNKVFPLVVGYFVIGVLSLVLVLNDRRPVVKKS
jgi:DHA1 family bicyclomycin/chloramphenicol resistance-like MFS transporter